MFWTNFTRLCNAKGASPSAVCQALGFSNATATHWKKGACPNSTSLLKIADYFGVTVASLTADAPADLPRPKLTVPVYGQVAAGIPIEAITDIDGYEEVDPDSLPAGEYIALRIHGHSMEPRMMEGDVVIVRLQDDVDSGETAVVLVNGGEATCKKIRKTPDGVMLISTNPAYEPMFYSNREILELPVRVLGKVVELRAKY